MQEAKAREEMIRVKMEEEEARRREEEAKQRAEAEARARAEAEQKAEAEAKKQAELERKQREMEKQEEEARKKEEKRKKEAERRKAKREADRLLQEKKKQEKKEKKEKKVRKSIPVLTTTLPKEVQTFLLNPHPEKFPKEHPGQIHATKFDTLTNRSSWDSFIRKANTMQQRNDSIFVIIHSLVSCIGSINQSSPF